jgi:hypothetical protein
MCMLVRLNVHAYLKRRENTDIWCKIVDIQNSVREKIHSKEIHWKTQFPQQSRQTQNGEDIKMKYTIESTIIKFTFTLKFRTTRINVPLRLVLPAQ